VTNEPSDTVIEGVAMSANVCGILTSHCSVRMLTVAVRGKPDDRGTVEPSYRATVWPSRFMKVYQAWRFVEDGGNAQ